jgi:hypothetical protein
MKLYECWARNAALVIGRNQSSHILTGRDGVESVTAGRDGLHLEEQGGPKSKGLKSVLIQSGASTCFHILKF